MRRFLFEGADLRGESTRVDGALAAILQNHQYAPGVRDLLGEFLAAAVLLATTLKFQGRLTLQARSSGQVPLIMAECTSDLAVRAIARGAQEATASGFEELLSEGQLAITVEPERGSRYQGIVPLQGESLAASLDAYFEQSEQLHTRVWLACDGSRAAGLLLQQLPSQLTPDPLAREAQWAHACTLAATVSREELLALEPAELLYRLYHEDPVRLFDAQPVRFSCSCSRERSRQALTTLGEAEIRDILREQGSVTMDCEFCNQQYIFEAQELLPGQIDPLH
ncbi:33 kDa chaperonin (HSP33) [Pseudohaliea rubra DSM 19751]|uniref:33 kDa chaperonin (HSP33) n=1 Tax=Pseudohaliea rubra DSM 19751 TaxID=1265313 RepID=A0A095VRH1_9GAMM|nr:33 kDa chaperonin (HSP33) [Pseudohaliea rubra DSM 19751]